jgi:hypothetical protein
MEKPGEHAEQTRSLDLHTLGSTPITKRYNIIIKA